MRVLHAAFMNEPSLGILNQMYWENESAKKLKLEWKSLLFVKNESTCLDYKYSDTLIFLNKNGWYDSHVAYYNNLLKKMDSFDVLLLRYSISDPLQYLFLKKIDKPVYLVHHTIETSEILSYPGSKKYIKYLVDVFFGALSLKKCKNIICVTNEIYSYENSRVNNRFKNKIIYPNGVNYSFLGFKDKKDSIPQILFIASYFNDWHGLDILLKSLKYNNSNFVLHLIGGLSDRDKEVAMRDERIILHGTLPPNKIAKIMENAWVGLSSFALHRKAMSEACTLKVREYLMYGIPVYSGHKDTFPEDFQYYYIGKPDIDDILKYAYTLKDISTKDISLKSKEFINKENLLIALYNNIKNEV
ncbi:glycosyltransferase family 1 protein [Acinetobacter variabilis]|uniref:glycosyltransferase family 1 protein n=1 Tax=Acinetobacter variabilis TaxID=70346 RepID=UPI0021D0B420|nr:glycosyltransferase family 1 protein [Acinetobacter variabilis]MCU4311795.1 glycosyltransferase family 1 protein [Acinetobacter variabilis]